jgi:hypothetical protein
MVWDIAVRKAIEGMG